MSSAFWPCFKFRPRIWFRPLYFVFRFFYTIPEGLLSTVSEPALTWQKNWKERWLLAVWERIKVTTQWKVKNAVNGDHTKHLHLRKNCRFQAEKAIGKQWHFVLMDVYSQHLHPEIFLTKLKLMFPMLTRNQEPHNSGEENILICWNVTDEKNARQQHAALNKN